VPETIEKTKRDGYLTTKLFHFDSARFLYANNRGAHINLHFCC